MGKSVEFYFDFGSPTSYLAYTQLPGIAKATGAELVYRPVLLGAVHKLTGNASPATVPAKARWMDSDLARYARQYGVSYRHNPFFPINTLQLMRGATAAQLHSADLFDRYVAAVFAGMWHAPENLGDPAVLGACLARAGLDAADLYARSQDPAVKDKLKSDTDAAVARGVFGAPTMFVGDDMFFGQDRLHFVREALAT